MLDFTNAEATDWWLAKRRYLVDELGIDGFKTDGGEHAWPSSISLRGRDARRRDEQPLPGRCTDRPLPLACAPVTFSRAGYTGSGGVPCHWAGDEDSTWEAFRASITAGLTAGASGVFFWASTWRASPARCRRRSSTCARPPLAALSPIMQYHSEFNLHRLAVARPHAVERGGADAATMTSCSVFRRFTELRERLVPYLAAEGAARRGANGVPLMRALLFDCRMTTIACGSSRTSTCSATRCSSRRCASRTQRAAIYLPAGEWVELGTAGGAGAERTVVSGRYRSTSIPLFITGGRAERAPAARCTRTSSWR